MLKLIPAVKHLEIKDGFFAKKAISFENADLDARLVKALNKLPEQLRAVVTLRYFAGYTLEETATALDIPRGTAATRQRKALQLLRLELSEEVTE